MLPGVKEILGGVDMGLRTKCELQGLRGPGDKRKSMSRAWPYLLVVPSPPGVGIGSRHRAGCVRKQILMELHSLARDRWSVSEAQISGSPIPSPGPSHFSGHVVADGYDGCVTQLQDLEHLTTHDSQCSPGDKGCPSQYALQNALGHCQGHQGDSQRGKETSGGCGGVGGSGDLPGLSAGCCGVTS